MPTIHYILLDGSRRSVDAKLGTSVMENAILSNIRGIDAECGGCCSCATCHVYVDEAFVERLVPADDEEADLLAFIASERLPNSRLSCQLAMTAELDGLLVRIPPTQV